MISYQESRSCKYPPCVPILFVRKNNLTSLLFLGVCLCVFHNNNNEDNMLYV